MRIVTTEGHSFSRLKSIKHKAIKYLSLKLEVLIAVGFVYSGYTVVATKRGLRLKQGNNSYPKKVKQVQLKIHIIEILLLWLGGRR